MMEIVLLLELDGILSSIIAADRRRSELAQHFCSGVIRINFGRRSSQRDDSAYLESRSRSSLGRVAMLHIAAAPRTQRVMKGSLIGKCASSEACEGLFNSLCQQTGCC